jgi:STAM-binding protein
VAAFIRSSNENTSKKIETCAILAGEEKNGQLHITTLIFPKQTGTQD